MSKDTERPEYVCQNCEAGGEIEPAVVRITRRTLGDKPQTIDLCESCWSVDRKLGGEPEEKREL